MSPSVTSNAMGGMARNRGHDDDYKRYRVLAAKAGPPSVAGPSAHESAAASGRLIQPCSPFPGGKTAGGGGSAIAIQAWDPKTPYLEAIRGPGGTSPYSASQSYEAYVKARADYRQSPSFYFDVSSFFEQTHGDQILSVRILTNVLELALDNAQLLRTVGYKLIEMNLLADAAGIFEKVLRLRPEEPQSHRDLALVLLAESAVTDPKRGLRLLDESIVGQWASRFEEIELTCTLDLARAIDFHGFDRAALVAKPGLRTPAPLTKLFPVDVRIVLAWDTDDTDVDLHVFDPTGEECNYNNKSTYIGGQFSRDFRRGLGPEEFVLKKAVPGKYIVKANYFANSRQSLTGATTLLVTVFKYFGTKGKEQREFVSVRLSKRNEMLQVAEVTFP